MNRQIPWSSLSHTGLFMPSGSVLIGEASSGVVSSSACFCLALLRPARHCCFAVPRSQPVLGYTVCWQSPARLGCCRFSSTW